MALDVEKINEANIKLESQLVKDRDDWKTKIKDLIVKSKNYNDLAECQVMMLSYRQILLDKVSEFKSTIYKRNAAWDKYWKELYRNYSLNYDIKLTNGEKNAFIKADLAPLKTQINLIESHVDYYDQCIRTLDNMAFAIRNRIQLEDNM
tara:strand:- start:9871 stop:10317 length:447 start_codon:yes stop_codon:yes gene_type:complete